MALTNYTPGAVSLATNSTLTVSNVTAIGTGTFTGNGSGLTNLNLTNSALKGEVTLPQYHSGGYVNNGIFLLIDSSGNIVQSPGPQLAGLTGFDLTGVSNIMVTGIFTGNASGLTNFSKLTFTNTQTFITLGATVTAAAVGEVFVSLLITNSTRVMLTNNTTHDFRPMGTQTGSGTNTDNSSFWVNSGDSITLTNTSGAGGATLLRAVFTVPR